MFQIAFPKSENVLLFTRVLCFTSRRGCKLKHSCPARQHFLLFLEEELRTHFEQFGKVEDIEWPYDKQTKAHRNFAFIVFEEEEAADRASAQPKQTFSSREVVLILFEGLLLCKLRA